MGRPDKTLNVLLARTSTLLLALVLLLAVAPQAWAQTPTFTIMAENVPEAFPTVETNSTSAITFRVTVAMTNVVCTQASVIPVTVTATPTGAPPGLVVEPVPAVANITVAAGAYPSANGQGAGFSGSADVGVQIVAGEIAENATLPVVIAATAEPPANCSGASAMSAASTEPATVNAQLVAPPPPPEEPAPPEEKGFLPGPGVLLGTLAALAAASLRRRRA